MAVARRPAAPAVVSAGMAQIRPAARRVNQRFRRGAKPVRLLRNGKTWENVVFVRMLSLAVLAVALLWFGLWLGSRPPGLSGPPGPPGPPAATPPATTPETQPAPPDRPTPDQPTPERFVRAEGRGLTRNGAPFRFRAVSFGNGYSLDLGQYGFSLDADPHNGPEAYTDVASLGFNAVRFGFNGAWLVDDAEAFWRWLDRNIAWAKAAGLLLTLELHVPIGGDWLDASTGASSFTLWEDRAVALQNVALWRQIAARYRDEPTIAGYDIFNEAVTTDATGDQWRGLAGEIVAAIRSVDPNHLIIAGPVYGTEGVYRPLTPEGQFLLPDGNVLYDVHFYAPLAFTHQGADWLAAPLAEGLRYPDPDRLRPTGAQVYLSGGAVASPRLASGTTGWRRYDSGWQELALPDAVAALPVAVLRDGAEGRVLFDLVELWERDPATGVVTRVVSDRLSAERLGAWWPWGSEGAGDGAFARVTDDGAQDHASLAIAAAAGPGAFYGWSAETHWRPVTPGHSYRISGWMRGEDIAYGRPGGYIGLALDVYGHPAEGGGPGFVTRGPAELAERLASLTRFGALYDVPMSVMEFGTIRATLERPELGGAVWVADMLALLDRAGLSYALWCYRDPSMGLYLGDPVTGTAAPNTALIEVVRAHLGAGG